VPKGFLRHYVLKLLDEKSMSGSEIMTIIAERTDNKWEPSPGSVYPLLAWLHESKYATFVEDQGIKTYTLTKKGKEFLEEHDEENPDFDQRISDFGIRYRGDISHLPKDVREIIKDFRKMRRIGWRLFKRFEKNYSEEVVKQTKEALSEFIEKLEVISNLDATDE
jgi:DNA-binding PadR family transcriptional regulator